MKHLIHEIHSGKNLEKNLLKYRELAIPLYMEYAALELTFSAFTMIQEITEEKTELAVREQRVISVILDGLDKLGHQTADYSEWKECMRQLREEITGKMDLFTAYTDRLICYEYVLNRMELKFLPEEELNQLLGSFDEEMYLKELMAFLFGNKDQSVVRDKLRLVLGQIPVYITKNKFFDRIREAMTLYRGGEKAALDDFLYMLRTSAMLYEPEYDASEYQGMTDLITKLQEADYTGMDAQTYEQLTDTLEQGARGVHEVTDFYYSLQKVVNCIYALCLILPYGGQQSKLFEACRSVWVCLSKREYLDQMMQPLEGRIEDKVEKTSYFESVLFEIKSSYKEQIKNLGLTGFFEDFAMVANLLSDSLFIDLERVIKLEKADAEYVRSRTESFLEELSDKMGEVSRPVKRAVMAQVLEKLPLTFQRSEQVEEYIRVNLLGCQDKAEKCTVMRMLRDLVQE